MPTNDSNLNSKHAHREIFWASVVALAITSAWALTPYIVAQFHPTILESGQFGDTFGSVNALFSGLALAGVVFAILLQRSELSLQRAALGAQLEELRLQREEIVANRAELARAATAQEESKKALQETIYASVFKTAFDILQEEDIRTARKVIYSIDRSDPVTTWDSGEMHCAELVCNSFDVVGIMVRFRMLPVEHVIDSWGVSLRDIWPKLKPFVDLQRAN